MLAVGEKAPFLSETLIQETPKELERKDLGLCRHVTAGVCSRGVSSCSEKDLGLCLALVSPVSLMKSV